MSILRQIVRGFSSQCGKPSRKNECNPKSKKAKKNRRPPDCIIGPSGVYPAHEGGFKMWRSMSIFVCLPLIAVCAYNTFSDHHEAERPPFVKLEYLRRRTKRFPWCGGTDRTLFHNPHLNPLPDGYED